MILILSVTFSIMFVGALLASLWMLNVIWKYNGCIKDPNIWCADTWVCNQTCQGFDPCFASSENLASCLYGPTSVRAGACYTPQEGSVSCPCNDNSGTSCLSGCPQNLASTTGTCCCNGPNCASC